MPVTVPFRAEHLRTLTPQPEQRAELEAAVASGQEGYGWTVQVGGKAVACAVLVGSGHRGAVFAFIGADAGPYMRRVYRVAERLFDTAPFRRIEATVLTGFAAGDRWMRMLKFELETPNGMRAFGPGGETHSLYARIK
jgi:hypothetical protein